MPPRVTVVSRRVSSDAQKRGRGSLQAKAKPVHAWDTTAPGTCPARNLRSDPPKVTFSPWTCQVYYRAPSIVLGDHLRSLSSPPSRGAGPREQPTCSCGQPRGSRYCRWLCPKCPFHTYVQGFLSLSRSRKAPALSPGLEKPHNASRGRWSPRAMPSPRWRGSECSREAEQAFCLPLIRKPRR